MAAKLDFDPHGADMTRIIDAWLPLTYAMNSINRSMGLQDFYPFVLAPAGDRQALLHPPAHARRRRHADAGKPRAETLRAIAAGLRRKIGLPE